MRPVTTAMMALLAGWGPLQDPARLKPLGVEPPIGGTLWTVVVPALLLLGACLATWLLYRRFSGE